MSLAIRSRFNPVRNNGTALPFSFEGKEIGATTVGLTGVANLEGDDVVLKIDDVVQFKVEGRVEDVDHKVRKADGKLVRIQRVKVVAVSLMPWDDDDPTDTGVYSMTQDGDAA